MKLLALSQVVVTTCALASSVSADMNTEDFTEYLNTSPETKGIALLYLNAALSAFQVANLELEERNQPPIFCMPGTLRVTEEDMAMWVEDALMKVQLPAGSDVPVTIALREVLTQRFPC